MITNTTTVIVVIMILIMFHPRISSIRYFNGKTVSNKNNIVTINRATSKLYQSKSQMSTIINNNNNENTIILSRNEVLKLISKVEMLNNINKDTLSSKFKEFYINNQLIGYVSNSMINNILSLKESKTIFKYTNDKLVFNEDVIKANKLHGYSDLFNNLNKQLYDLNIIKGKWNNELLPILNSYYDEEPLLLIERVCYPYYGIKGYGVHVNGYISDNYNNIPTHLWIGKRSSTKSTYPSLLDHIVAGGQPYGLSLLDNVIKECDEEANIDKNLVLNNIKSTGYVSYQFMDNNNNLKRDILFCYDLKLPLDFVPIPKDNEVESFRLLPVTEILNIILNTDEFKPNVNTVIIDFLIRHGIISNMSPDYLYLCNILRNIY